MVLELSRSVVVLVPLLRSEGGACLRSRAILVPFDADTRRFGPPWVSPPCEIRCAPAAARFDVRAGGEAVELTLGQACTHRVTWTGTWWSATQR